MEKYDAAFAPVAFGLHNTGAICYLNSFLQSLAGCTSFTRAVLGNAATMSATRTGAAMFAFVAAYATASGAKAQLSTDIGFHSAKILHALMADLAVRRKKVHFGGGQESASEALVLLLDMLEVPTAAELSGIVAASNTASNPITRLFQHSVRCDLHCARCRKKVSSTTDQGVAFNMFHIDTLQVTTAEEFSKAICLHVSQTKDYFCPECKEKSGAYRVYQLTMLPEIVVCVFNLYVGFGGARRARFFPAELEFPSGADRLVYRLVGQVEHSGSLDGGHYWARARRAGGVFTCNDSQTAPEEFAPTPNSYIVMYHYLHKIDGEKHEVDN